MLKLICSNKLLENTIGLTMSEMKVVCYVLSNIQTEDDGFKPYSFGIKKFMDAVGVVDKSRYNALRNITKGLMKKVFEIHEGDNILQVAYFSSVLYKKGDGTINIKISSDILPYLKDLKANFTQLDLHSILQMKSKYSIKLYQILKQNEFKGKYTISIKDLRVFTDTTDLFTRYNDFKKKVILQAEKEINEVSDIYFDFIENKEGRKIESITFYIHRKETPTKENKIVHKSKKKEVKNSFNNFEEREIYSDVQRMKDLENKLLGWD